jgi:hypothetical protein
MDLRTYILVRCAELREETRKRQLRPALQEPVLLGLLRALPPIGSSFPEKQQKLWLEAAKATLDLLYES